MISGLAVVIVMLCLLLPVNLVNRIRLRNELKKTISFIMESGGDLSGSVETEDRFDFWHEAIENVTGRNRSLNLTPESRYQLRYFTVVVEQDGTVSDLSLSHIAAVDEKLASEMAKRALSRPQTNGFLEAQLNSYFYLKQEPDEGRVMIGFLECTREVVNLQVFFYISMGFGLLLILVFLVIIAFLSRRAMQPYIDNIESQREFITNAGHELKTPLAIRVDRQHSGTGQAGNQPDQ